MISGGGGGRDACCTEERCVAERVPSVHVRVVGKEDPHHRLIPVPCGGGEWARRAVGPRLLDRPVAVGEIVIWGAGTQMVRLDDFTVELVGEGRSPSASSRISLVDGWDYAARDTRGWVAGRSRDDTAGAPVVYSATLGEAWIEQPVGFDGVGALLTIDFFVAATGVTCGFGRKDAESEPLCFWTAAARSSWRWSDVVESTCRCRSWTLRSARAERPGPWQSKPARAAGARSSGRMTAERAEWTCPSPGWRLGAFAR